MFATTTPLADLAARISGRVVTDADPAWDEVRQVFNLTTDLRPAAIVLPVDAVDVAITVDYARAHGLQVAPQATGHNAAALGSLPDTLLVDVRELRDIRIDSENRRVRVGAGVRWQDVVPQLSELGLAALHGSSPLVGIAGYSLGGGMGWLARKHGLQANSVTALEVVTADGRRRRVTSPNQPALFWALRGGNGNFGVVTAIEFEVYPVSELYAGAMFFPHERAT
ncbi:MAG: FAD-dependent oxidoreductase, partial [Marmoricola sp.]